jgi:hypothetical protein
LGDAILLSREVPIAGSGARPFPFVITGRISAVDPRCRLLRIGETALDVGEDVALEGFGVGMQVIVSGEMHPASGRALARSVALAVPTTASPGSAVHELPLVTFVRSVLDELGEFDVECELTFAERRASVRLWLPDEIGKEIHLSRRMLEWGLVSHSARRTIRNVLQTAIGILRSQRALQAVRDTRYQCRMDGLASAERQCARCGRPMTEVPWAVEDFHRRHLACPDHDLRPGPERR